MRLFGILAIGTLLGGFVALFKKLVIDNLTKSIDGLRKPNSRLVTP